MALIPRKRMSSDLLDPKPREGSFNGVTSDGVFKSTGEAIDNILDDGSASETIVVAVPSSQSDNYTVGDYYEVQGKVARLRTKTTGDNVTQLTFDTTSGLLDAMNGIVEDITSIGSPLQWKGPATVSQLNTGITGIQAGWTYTLTDSGTLTDGSIAVEAGEEVAWTENGEWFKVGGESSKIAVFTGAYNPGASPADYSGLPDQADVLAAIDAGKDVVLMLIPQTNAPYLVYRLSQKFQYNHLFLRADISIRQGHILYRDYLGLSYAGPGNPWMWSGWMDDILDTSVFIYRTSLMPSLSDIQAARDAGKAVFLVCGEDVSTGLNDVTLEKGTVLTLVFDTGRPGYSSHSMEFMCTGMFGGSGCKTVKAVVNGDNTWSWITFDHDKIFIASYGTTGIADIIAAREAGKFVVLKLNADGGFAQLYFWYGSPQMAQFIDAASGTMYENREDVWSTSSWTPTGAVGWGGALTDAASVNVPNNALSTLSTAQAALTLNVNVDSGKVPNFAVEITPSVDVTLTVTKTVGNTMTTLNPSAAGGNSLTTGKLYQVTCVGSCWTLAEFTVPTP